MSFADGVIVFTKGTVAAINIVKKVLSSFAEVSGLTVRCCVHVWGVY